MGVSKCQLFIIDVTVNFLTIPLAQTPQFMVRPLTDEPCSRHVVDTLYQMRMAGFPMIRFIIMVCI